MSGRFARSEAMLRAALEIQATGPLPYAIGLLPAVGVPHYFRAAHGAELEDIDGNRLIDLHNGWGAAILGHGSPEVAEAVGRTLRDGVAALPTELEARVAERLVALRPWADSVRFAKTGSDAMAIAIRLARALTGRELIAVSGYHGWHDTTAAALSGQRGIPAALRSLSLRFDGSDPSSLSSLLAANRVAAVVLEPARIWPPDVAAHATIGTLARRHGAVLIHDEVASGLRTPCLQTLGVEPPDMTVLGKGLANGLPLAAVLGNDALLAPTGPGLLLYSGSTHESVCLAAAEAVLTRLGDPSVAAALAHADAEIRCMLATGVAESCLVVEGHPGLITLRPRPDTAVGPAEIRLLLVQELLARDVYCLGTIYTSAAHDDAVLEALHRAVAWAMGSVSRAVSENRAAERLQMEVPHREVIRR